MANNISQIKLPDNTDLDLKATLLPYGETDSTSTATALKATVPGITKLENGVVCVVRNTAIAGISGYTLNVNDLGAKPLWASYGMVRSSAVALGVTYVLVYNDSVMDGGAWIIIQGYYASNSDTLAYMFRTGYSTRAVADTTYRYRILFESADGTKWVPSTTSTSTNATAAREVNQRPINPFGDIVYYGVATVVSAGGTPDITSLWQQHYMTLGYAFNRTGAALTLTYPAPVYIKCTPQEDGSAIIDATEPYVQALPTSEDGFIYIYLGRAYSTTAVEIVYNHPIYYYKDGAIRLWTNQVVGSGAELEAITDEELDEVLV